MNDLYGLLRNRKILDILDGDTELGEEIKIQSNRKNIKNALPYLSGRQICEISNKFGLPINYYSPEGTQSRWAYLDDLFVFCMNNNRVADLLSFLLSREQFAEKLAGYTPDEIDQAYATITENAINIINGHLSFGGNELVNVNNTFVIQKRGAIPQVVAPFIKQINRKYIYELSQRAMEDVDKGHYDSAITKSRTLLEEVFCYKIEKKGQEPSDSGDIGRLYSQVKDLYEMHPDKLMDKRVNMLLSGLEKIISAIREMRNEASDSHGVGARRIDIDEYHARLFVNASMAMADFILSVGEQ